MDDLGETIITEVISTGPSTQIRKVRVHGHEQGLTDERHFWGASSLDKKWVQCLEPVEDAGAAR